MAKIKTYYEAGKPIPKSLGRCADQLKKVRELRLLMDKETKVVKEREAELEAHLIENLSLKDGDTGASGIKYKAQVSSVDKPSVTDWDALYDHILKNKKRFRFLGRSVAVKACEEVWAAGKKVPGVSVVHVKKLSLTKI